MSPLRCFSFTNVSKKQSKASAKMGLTQLDGNTSLEPDHRSETISGVSSLQSQQSSPVPMSLQKMESLRVFTFAEMKAATNNFSRSLVLGEGGFGCVYRGKIISSGDPQKEVEVAVKQSSHRGMQGYRQWLTEVNVLGMVEHPNLVKLIGFCTDDDERGMQRLLVYELMPNRSVRDHISPQSDPPLPWQMRLRVALDAARGLTYLHEEMSFQIIFRDLKTTNILLDEHWNAKLSDFGLARQGPEEGWSHVSTAVVGTIGYAAPEYMQTGHLTAKSDLWSYGVVLYELITGRRPVDHNRPKGEQKLLDWVRPYVTNFRNFHSIVDPRIVHDYDLRSVQQLAAVANRCLVRNPKKRPKMSEVLAMVAGVISTAAAGSPLHVRLTGEEEEEARQRRRGE